MTPREVLSLRRKNQIVDCCVRQDGCCVETFGDQTGQAGLAGMPRLRTVYKGLRRK